MSEYFKGTVLASPIVKSASGNTYGTHHSIMGVGGYMEVNTITERNAIPVNSIYGTMNYDGISSGQRRLGMLVYVYETDTICQLHPKSGSEFISYSAWTGYTDTAKYNALSDNNSWYPLITKADEGTVGSGKRISEIYNQITHSFVVGDVIGYNGNNFEKVNSSSALTVEPLGVITTSDWDGSAGANASFTLTYAGYVDTTGMVDFTGGTLSGGTVYYLASSGYTGKLTEFQPTGVTEISKPMLVKTSGTTAIVLQYRGTSKEEAGVTLGDFYTYTGDTQAFLDTTVTGATNIGHFIGTTGVQTLSILTSDANFNGNYISEYNNYYRDSSGIIRIGSPTYNGILRRGYISEFEPKKSWLYNVYTGGTNQVGWALVDGDISESVGSYAISNTFAGTPPFTETEWWYTGGTLNDGYYSNGTIALDVNGDLYTGDTYNVGGPVYSDKQYHELRLRTIMTNTPDTTSITYDNSFVYIDNFLGDITGVTTGATVGDGRSIYSGKTGTTLIFKSIKGSGDTSVHDYGDELIVYSSGGSGGAYYNLDTPSTVTVGGIVSGTQLTGKTAFELFEEMLVPTLNPTLTSPSNSFILTSPVSIYSEVGYVGDFAFLAGFNRGSISPAYGTSGYRSGLPTDYNYTGTGLPTSASASTLTNVQISSGYTVLIGVQSWTSSVTHLEGDQPKDSVGNDYDSPYPSGTTGSVTETVEGVYPLFGTTSVIGTLTKQTLISMLNSNNVLFSMVAETGGNKQTFEIPDAWLGAPTNRSLTGIQTYNTFTSTWEYQGGNATASLTFWTTSSVTETIQGSVINYTRYVYNSADRSAINIRLVF